MGSIIGIKGLLQLLCTELKLITILNLYHQSCPKLPLAYSIIKSKLKDTAAPLLRCATVFKQYTMEGKWISKKKFSIPGKCGSAAFQWVMACVYGSMAVQENTDRARGRLSRSITGEKAGKRTGLK